MKWFGLTLALPMYFTELLTHGLEDEVVLLGFGLEQMEYRLGYLVLSKAEKNGFYELFDILFSHSVYNSHIHMNPNTTTYGFVFVQWILTGYGRLWVRGKGWCIIENGEVYTCRHTTDVSQNALTHEF